MSKQRIAGAHRCARGRFARLPRSTCVALGWIALILWADRGWGQKDEAAIRRYTAETEQAMTSKDLSKAAAALEKLVKLTPEAAEVRANLGMVYYTEGHYLEAEAAFQKAVQLNPGISNGRLMIALCEAELGHWKQAQPALEAAFRSPPGPEIGRTVGIKLMQTDAALAEPIKALAVSEDLLRRYPDDPQVLYRASHLYGDRALEVMTHLVEVAPNSPWKILAFGEALEAQKRYDLAIIQYRKVLAADPELPGAHYRLGRALLLSDPDNADARAEALTQFQAALQADPRNAGAEYEMGEIYRRGGESEKAADDFLKAVEIDPHFEQAQIAAARVLLEAQKPREAVAHLEIAVKINPGNEVSHFFLARAYRTLGDEAGAKREHGLYEQCHARSLPSAENGDKVPREIAPSAVTPQTVSPESRSP